MSCYYRWCYLAVRAMGYKQFWLLFIHSTVMKFCGHPVWPSQGFGDNSEWQWMYCDCLNLNFSNLSVSSLSEVQYVVLQNVATMTIKRRVSHPHWFYLLLCFCLCGMLTTCLWSSCVCFTGHVWTIPEELLHSLHRPDPNKNPKGIFICSVYPAVRIFSGVCGDQWENGLLFCLLQLEVLTNLANETNISTILREFQVQWEGIFGTLIFFNHGIYNAIIFV